MLDDGHRWPTVQLPRHAVDNRGQRPGVVRQTSRRHHPRGLGGAHHGPTAARARPVSRRALPAQSGLVAGISGVLRVVGGQGGPAGSAPQRCGRPASRANAGGEFVPPGPVSGDAEPSSALASGDPGGDVQEPVAQRLRCTDGEVTVQVGGLGPGDQVAGGQGRVQPDRVDGDLPGGEPAQAGVLAQPMRSSTRAWARCRASSQASCPARCRWRRSGTADRRHR